MKTFKGEWFLPNNPNLKVRGVLSCDPVRGNSLEIEDSFLETPTFGNITKEDVVLGITTDGTFITLYSCFEEGFELGTSYKATWYVWQVFIGCHTIDKNDLRFTEVVLRIKPLFLWLNNSGINREGHLGIDGQVTFTYKTPEPIHFLIDETVTGKFTFEATASYPTTHSDSIQMTHWAEISLSTHQGKDLQYEKLWQYCAKFIQWLQVITGYQCTIEDRTFRHRIDLVDEVISGKQRELDIANYGKTYVSTKNPRTPRDLFTTYQKVERFMPEALTKWFLLYESIEPVIQILSSTLVRGEFGQFIFKDVVQALEAFHRKLIRNERMPKAEYKKFKTKILDQLEDLADKEFVKERINYGNEPSLRERLSELIELAGEDPILSIIGDKDEFIKTVVENRNFHTHLDLAGKKNILEISDLYHLTEKALSLLFISILNLIFPDKEFIAKVIRSSSRWGWRATRGHK
ncbi:HEPN domain-containing protein [Fibrella sp. ES10-3-2-2]|nr:hypothetical protein A6C57_08545 [Fibrella sp. ES10-3-2-2]